SPGATSRSTSRTACRPPKRRPIPRRRRIGATLSTRAASVTRLPGDLWVLCLADPRQAAFHARRTRSTWSRCARRERAAERLVDVRDIAHRLHRQLAALLVQLLVVDGDDPLAVLVEGDRAVAGAQLDLADRLLQRLLTAGKISADLLQALD